MSTPNKGGAKTMSSRLANMKFMQRSGAAESPQPATPDQPSAKRQRMSNGTYNASPGSTPGSSTPVIHTPEEKKRMEASEREAAAKGETKWYLSVQNAPKPTEQTPLRIISAGYGDLDAGRAGDEDDSEEDNTGAASAPGRMNFGNFGKKQPKKQDSGSSGESSSESDSESEEDEEDDPTGTKALLKQSQKEAGDRARAERKAQRKAESKEAGRLAEARRKKEVNLNKVTSISGSGGKPSSSMESMVCHNCGKKGHIKAQCPQAAKKSRKPRS